jgi:hypothetical protein
MSGRSFLFAIAVAATASGCPTVDLGDSPPNPGTCRPDPLFYRERIWPEYLAPTDPNLSCVVASGCHDSNNGRSAFRVNTAEPIDHDANYQVVIRFLNCGSPDDSSLFTKPVSSVDSHGGGDLFPTGSNAEAVFLEWFDQ